LENFNILIYANCKATECDAVSPAIDQCILWKPVIEPDFGQERFLVEDPIKSYQNDDFMKVPIITGMTKDEFVGPALCKY